MLLPLLLNNLLGVTGSDTTPDAFTFTAQTGVARGLVVESNTITVSGINAETAISVTGGYISINGGEYTAFATTVENGDTVRVKRSASSNYATTVSATVTIGGVSGVFSLTTEVRPPRRRRILVPRKRRVLQ